MLRRRRAWSPPARWDGITRAYDGRTGRSLGWARRYISTRSSLTVVVASGALSRPPSADVDESSTSSYFYEHWADGGLHVVVTPSPVTVWMFPPPPFPPRTALYACLTAALYSEEDPHHHKKNNLPRDLSAFLNERVWTIHMCGIPFEVMMASLVAHGMSSTFVLVDAPDAAPACLLWDIVVALDDSTDLRFSCGQVVMW